jgi:hypothetical protein
MGVIEPRRLFRLPWTAADNAMTWLEPTRRCNITCDACFATNDAGSEKSLEQVAHELRVMQSLRRCDAMLIAGGEPLTHPQIVEIVRLVGRSGVKAIIVTNGVLLDRPLLRGLKGAGAYGFTFHVDAHQARPGWIGAREADLNALRSQFADLLYQEGNLCCAFNTTIFPDTLKDVPAIVGWAVKHPERVHILTLICVRMAEINGPFAYYVGNQQIDFGRTPYVTDQEYQHLTTEQLYAEIKTVLPEFEFCAYLGGTIQAKSLKWVLGSHLCTKQRSFGTMGARSMEILQNSYHMLRGRYLAYTSPKTTRHGRLTLLLSILDPCLRKALARYLASLVRHPRDIARRVHVQNISVVQPVDILPNGEMDTCDGCPNRTYWNERLVPACRLEEYKLYGGPAHAVPRNVEKTRA